MTTTFTESTLAQPFDIVNPDTSQCGGTPPESMIHHKVGMKRGGIVIGLTPPPLGQRYGVSSSSRVLTPGLFNKRYDRIRTFLQYDMGIPRAEREVLLYLLRLWAYYGIVCPTERVATEETMTSKATFWRAIRRLEKMNLIEVVNRYVIRPQAQISNLYYFHRLVIALARYLAEQGVGFYQRWLKPYMMLTGTAFWHGWFHKYGPPLRSGPVSVS